MAIILELVTGIKEWKIDISLSLCQNKTEHTIDLLSRQNTVEQSFKGQKL